METKKTRRADRLAELSERICKKFGLEQGIIMCATMSAAALQKLVDL